jgi:ribosome-associated protein
MMALTAKREYPLDAQTLASRIRVLTDERKAVDISVVDVRGRSSYTDFLVVASGTSDRHVSSIAEYVETTLKQEGITALGSEGLREGQWALIDFGNVILHVFHPFTRTLYDLETLWNPKAHKNKIKQTSAENSSETP